MKYKYYWGISAETNQHIDSLCLYQIVTVYGKAGIAFFCVPDKNIISNQEQAIRFGGTMCEKVAGWFYSDFLQHLHKKKSWRAIRHSFLRVVSDTEQNITPETEKTNVEYSFIVLIWYQNHYRILNCGKGEVFIKKKYPNQLVQIKQCTKIKEVHGNLHDKTKILIAAGALSNTLSKHEIMSVFRSDHESADKMKKILKECNSRIVKKKREKDVSLLLIHFCEEDL